MADKSTRVSLESVGLKPRDDNPLNFKVDTTDDSDVFLGTLNKEQKETFNKLKKLYESSGLNLIKELSKDKIKIGKDIKFAKGGTPMATQTEQQMEMMLEGGGLKDEGGTIDPVSGNEVPDGATQEGVRDDVPAMLSEGEYVMNEASTRYHGVNKLNSMQEEAKQGYSQMERDGLMGEPVDEEKELPFGMQDLNVSDEEGRELMMADGGLVPNGFNMGGLEQGAYDVASGLFGGGAGGNSSGQRKLNPVEDTGMPQRRPQPTFEDSMGGAGGFTFKMYTHPDGRNMMVPFMNGIPMFNIPEGFVLTDPNNPTPTPEPEPTDPIAEPVKPAEAPDGPDDPVAGQVRGFDQMSPNDIFAFSNLLSKFSPTLEKNWPGLSRAKEIATVTTSGQFNRKKQSEELMKAERAKAKAIADEKAKRNAEIKSQQEMFDKLRKDKAAADKRNKELEKSIEEANLNKDVYRDTDMAEAVADEGKPAAGVDMGAPDGSMSYTGGPDGYGGGDYSGGDANSGGDFSGADFGGSFGYFEKGGLAGKKPKKKTKTYKKGGLATR